jgi:hypothetical protein
MFTITAGSKAVSVRFLIVDERNGLGVPGVTPETEGLQAATIRDGESLPEKLHLCMRAGDLHTPGALREIDSGLMPGLYELDLPDGLLEAGSHRLTLMVQTPGAAPVVIHFDLVGYDPYDSYRLGLECLTRESRHEVISRAFREVVPEIVEEFRREM